MKWLIAIAFLASTARADVTDDTIAEAKRLAEAKDFDGAARKFLEAYKLDARPDLICNIGVAYYKAGAFHRAHLFLGRCLERSTSLEADFVKQVHAVLSSVEEALHAGNFAPVDVAVDPAGTAIAIAEFGADAAFVGSRTVWLPFGKHAIVATAAGFESATQTVEIADHDAKQLVIKLAPIALPPPPPKPVRLLPRPRPSPIPAIAVTAGTVAAGIFTGIAYGRAHDHADLAPFAISQAAYEREKTSVGHWNTAMVTGSIATFVGAGVAGYLWFAVLHEPGMIEVAPTEGGVAMAFGAHW